MLAILFAQVGFAHLVFSLHVLVAFTEDVVCMSLFSCFLHRQLHVQ